MTCGFCRGQKCVFCLFTAPLLENVYSSVHRMSCTNVRFFSSLFIMKLQKSNRLSSFPGKSSCISRGRYGCALCTIKMFPIWNFEQSDSLIMSLLLHCGHTRSYPKMPSMHIWTFESTAFPMLLVSRKRLTTYKIGILVG